MSISSRRSDSRASSALDAGPRLRGGGRRSAGAADRPNLVRRLRLRGGEPSGTFACSSGGVSSRTTTGPGNASGATTRTRTPYTMTTRTMTMRRITTRRKKSTAWRRPTRATGSSAGRQPPSACTPTSAPTAPSSPTSPTRTVRRRWRSSTTSAREHVGNLAFEVGNPNLDAETTLGIDLSLRHQTRRVRGDFNVYFYDIDNFIFGDRTDEVADNLPVLHFIQGDSRFVGFDARERPAGRTGLLGGPDIQLDRIKGAASMRR